MVENLPKKIWLTSSGLYSRPSNKAIEYIMTLQSVHFVVSFFPDERQTHIHFSRNDLIMIRNAIDKEIPKEETEPEGEF